ncbi:MAG: glycoside hydrolase family 25 protein [Bacteroidota bacterium]
MRPTLVIISLFALIVACQSVTERIETYDMQGIDVSHYQSRVDWDKVAAHDISFGFVKATEGESMQDSLFSLNWLRMKEVGIRRGAYHFFRPQVPAIVQARNFIRTVSMDYGDLPPVLDIEVSDNTSREDITKGLKIWLTMIEKHYEIRPIIYTNLKFYYRYIMGQFDDYPVWIARYNTRPPQLPFGRKWTFWQYGNRGQIDGIDGPVDFNVFNGTFQDLEELSLQPRSVFSATEH